jgi:hypothetical protein
MLYIGDMTECYSNIELTMICVCNVYLYVQFGAALAAYAIKGAMAGSQVRQIKGKHGSSK